MKVFQKIFCCLVLFLFLVSGADSILHRDNSVLFLTEHNESNKSSGNESQIHLDNSEKEFTISNKDEDYISSSASVTVMFTVLIPEKGSGASVWQPPEIV